MLHQPTLSVILKHVSRNSTQNSIFIYLLHFYLVSFYLFRYFFIMTGIL